MLLIALMLSAMAIFCGASVSRAAPVLQTSKAEAEKPKAAAETPKVVTEKPKAATETPKVATEKPKAAAETPEEEEEEVTPYSLDYKCYQDATQEENFQKRGSKLLECIKNHKTETLMPNFEAEFKTSMFKAYDDKKWEDLEFLAEQWLKLHPDDYQATAFQAAAKVNLGKKKEYIQVAINLYKMKPMAKLAEEISRVYEEIGQQDKYIEWVEIALKFPENDANFVLRYKIFRIYIDPKSTNLPKALDWAQATLKAANSVIDPSEDIRKQLKDVRFICYDQIAKILYKQDKFCEAINNFEQAIKIKEYAEGYYFIALALQLQKKADDAMVWYAKTVNWCKDGARDCGELPSKAKAELEKIYKPLHDGSLIGIEKIYNKAKNDFESYWASAAKCD